MSWAEFAVRLWAALYLLTLLRMTWSFTTRMRYKAIGEALDAECRLIITQIQLEKAKRNIPDRCMGCGHDIPFANARLATIEGDVPINEQEQSCETSPESSPDSSS